MAPEVWSAIIGGLSGVASAYLTARLTTHGASTAARRAEEQSAKYLAVQVAPALRRFAESCLDAAYDDGYEEGQMAGGDQARATVTVNAFKPEDFADVDWKSLPAPLMVDVLCFPDRHQAVQAALSDWDHYYNPPDHPEYFADRQSSYAKLGLEAVSLGVRLFKETGHASELPGATDLQRRLLSRAAELADERRRVEEKLANRRSAEVDEPVGEGSAELASGSASPN